MENRNTQTQFRVLSCELDYFLFFFYKDYCLFYVTTDQEKIFLFYSQFLIQLWEMLVSSHRMYTNYLHPNCNWERIKAFSPSSC